MQYLIRKGSMRNILKDYSKEILISLISALIIGAFGMFYKNFILPSPELNGGWIVYVKTERTEYKPYKNLICIFSFSIVKNSDNTFTGAGEKVKDINPDGTITSYATVQRDRVIFKGTIEQGWFTKPKVYLALTERGSRFTTTANYTLQLVSNDSLVGNFTSTIANESGEVFMRRNM